jgi:Xaa-Pro aminopeptidase
MTSQEAQRSPPAPKDNTPPAALLAFMMESWAPPAATSPHRHPDCGFYAARRAALASRFPDETLVIPTGHAKVRANDTHYPFRPGSDYFWLTGHQEPDGVLVLVCGRRGRHQAHLFVEPNPGKRSETFFTDRKKGELWVGPRLGVPETRDRTGVEAAHPLSELRPFLKARRGARLLRGLSATTDALVAARGRGGSRGQADQALATALSELRLIKDALEIAELEKAIASTRRGFEDVIRALGTARTERAVEGVFGLRARVEGNGVGYETIAASGAHACTLHWSRNDGPVGKRELLLLDAGVEGHALYTADITRTLPVSGRFSRAQREIYELVHRAQRAAMAQVKPGNDFLEPNRHAMRVLAEGLEDLGILPMPAREALQDEHQFYKRYSLHTVSHMLGLDVHDCASARPEVARHGPLRPGMVLTIEPGLYFQPDDLTVPPRYRGIGVRIEDDVLVTADGVRNLSRSIPSSASAVERWMERLRRRPANHASSRGP